jgi:glycosyltransferase involved in cell wall biosynthesis
VPSTVGFISRNVTQGNGAAATILDAVAAVATVGYKPRLYLTGDNRVRLALKPARRRLAKLPLARIHTGRWNVHADVVVVAGLLGLHPTAAAALNRSNAPTVLSHSGSVDSFRRGMTEAFPDSNETYERYLTRFDHVVFQTPDIADEAVELVPALNPFVVRPSTDEPAVLAARTAPSPYGPDERPLVMVGPVMERKGQLLAVEAFTRLAGEFPDTHLHLVGSVNREPAYVEQVRDCARTAGLTARVHLHGRQPALPYLAHAELLVHSSLGEGASRVIREAMLIGLPCVAFDIPGTRDLVAHGETGHLAPVGDTTAVARHARELLRSKDRYADMSDAARRRYAERHSWATYCTAWGHVLASVT